MTTEQIYDEQVNHLMLQIIAICERHKIPMLAEFALRDEAGEHVGCTTALLGKEYNPPDMLVEALHVIRKGRQSIALRRPKTVTKPSPQFYRNPQPK